MLKVELARLPSQWPRIWVIGGTRESVELVEQIASLNLPCTVTVTTAAAERLYPQLPQLRVCVGCLDADRIEAFLQQENIAGVLDASHPYAVDVSRMAIAAAQDRQIPYLRFERVAVRPESDPSNLIYLENMQVLVEGDYLAQQRVLLAVGYKALPLFKPWQTRSTLFARILPSMSSLEVTLNAGFTADRIIALRPPLSTELELALWRHWDISLAVTKASGTAGGEEIKRKVAAQLGIPLIVITRPVVAYPQQTHDFSTALEFCQTCVGDS